MRRAASLLIVGILWQSSALRAEEKQFFSFPKRLFKPASPANSSTAPTSSKLAQMKPAEAANACLVTAQELAQGGHRREAILLYEKARQLDPKQKQVCRHLAALYDLEKNDAQALVEYQKALELAPKDPDLLNDFGYFHYERGDWANAERYLRDALLQDNRHQRAWTNLGLTFGAQGRYQEGFEAFSKAVDPAAAHSNIGMIMARHGRHADADRAFQQALSLDPHLPQAKALQTYLAQRNIAESR